MTNIIQLIDKINSITGKLVSWITVLLTVLIAIDVVIRYIFQFTFVWMIETEIYLFGMLFLLASGYTFANDTHVRVDVFYAKFSKKQKAWVDLLGGALLLIPWCYVVIVTSWYYGLASFQMNEGSAQPGGLPALYILKFCITIGFTVLSIQAVSQMLKALQVLLKK